MTTNRAKAIPQGFGDVDALRMAILLKRLERSDLDPRSEWQLHVVLRTIYLTGWPISLCAQLGSESPVTLDAAAGSITLHRSIYPLEVKTDGDGVRLTIGGEVLRLLRSAIDPDGSLRLRIWGHVLPISASLIPGLLRYLNAEDACPTTLAMLRGAVWQTGRALGWTPERLVLATCTWDPAFTRAFHYLSPPTDLDVRALHDAMARRLRHGMQRLTAIEAGRGFTVI